MVIDVIIYMICISLYFDNGVICESSYGDFEIVWMCNMLLDIEVYFMLFNGEILGGVGELVVFVVVVVIVNVFVRVMGIVLCCFLFCDFYLEG